MGGTRDVTGQINIEWEDAGSEEIWNDLGLVASAINKQETIILCFQHQHISTIFQEPP